MFRKEITGIKKEIIGLRRGFHRYPELAFQEKKSAEVIARYLKELGLEVKTGIAGTGVMGLLAGPSRGKTLLLRADMDALPISEQNKVPYRSKNEGVMHACGHDGHMAILLAAARILTAHRNGLKGSVKFVFQPGEEGYGGARIMIKEGVLKKPKVQAALGLHLSTQLPTGMVGLRPGATMSGMDDFSVKIHGRGGHAAVPDSGVDAILMSAQAITALQSIISKEVSPLRPLVLHVGLIRGGDAFNVIAESAEFHGTVRTFDEALRQSMPERMDRVLKGVTQALRGTHELDYQFGYPPVINDPEMTGLVRQEAERVLGREMVIEIPAVMSSDDMAYFQDEVPGCYFFLGAGNKDKNLDQPNHNSRFDFDEEALLLGTEVMVSSAVAYLG